MASSQNARKLLKRNLRQAAGNLLGKDFICPISPIILRFQNPEVELLILFRCQHETVATGGLDHIHDPYSIVQHH